MERGSQDEYNKLLEDFSAKTKTKRESVNYLMSIGFSQEQAENAVHVYWKGGKTRAIFRLTRDDRNRLLEDFNARQKTPKECVAHLRNHGCTYRQASSAVYKYRKEKGLIG